MNDISNEQFVAEYLKCWLNAMKTDDMVAAWHGYHDWTVMHMNRVLYPLAHKLGACNECNCSNCRKLTGKGEEDRCKYFCKMYAWTIQQEYYNIDFSLYNSYKQTVWSLEYAIEHENAEFVLGKGDTTLEKWEHDFIVAEMEAKIADLKKELEANPNDAQKKAELDELSKKEHDYKLENAKLMVERYPNDFNYRYIYGQLLFEDGKLDDAIMQFQLSQRNPKVRIQSLLGLGRAFIKGKKYDLAVDQLETAKKESKIMNDSKKEIIYELACAYELMGQADKAFNEYKEIYSADISYKDVSDKINAYYASRNS